VAHTHDRRSAAGAGRTSTAVLARHPLLSLQQSAGNRVVTQAVQRQPAGTAVQRKEDRYVSSDVALAVTDKIYKGKCDATFDDVGLRYKSSPGLLSKDVAITFVCGPQRFKFGTTMPWLGERFPWDIELATGSTAWLTSTVSKALDTIYEHWDDEGGGFWAAHKTVKAALKHDIDRYCAP
jgi:hypothetical protein